MVHQSSVVHSNTVLPSSSEWAYEGLSSPYRYISAGLMTVSNVGYFYHGFSVQVCSKYYMAAPVLKGESVGTPHVGCSHTLCSDSDYGLPSNCRLSNLEHRTEIKACRSIPLFLWIRDRRPRVLFQPRISHTPTGLG